MNDAISLALEESIPWSTPGEIFTSQLLGAGRWPAQGWKLHVSATPGSAPAVLACTMPLLLQAGVRFKVVNSQHNLSMMNSGMYGETQVGKFITVYPSDDDEAVRLANELHIATLGHRGPRVPSDRPLHPGSLVHYRYGVFQSSSTRASQGGDLSDAEGRSMTDWRCPSYVSPPPEIPDPFEEAGIVTSKPARKGALAGRFIVHTALNRSWRGGVYQAIDLTAKPPRPCLLKERWRDVGSGDDGCGSADWTNNETNILRRHGNGSTIPRCYGDFELEGNHYVVLEFVPGSTLDELMAGRVSANGGLGVTELLSIMTGTAVALRDVHDLGIVYRDFKPSNAIFGPDGVWRLIDFGIAYDPAIYHSPVTGGTPAFCSPQQWNQGHPAPSDDIFSWGAVMYLLACGYDSLIASEAQEDTCPHPRPPILEKRPSLPSPLALVLDRACAWEVTDRFSTMAEVCDALAVLSARLNKRSFAETSTSPTPMPVPIAAAAAMAEAVEIGTRLCGLAKEHRGGLNWMTRVDKSDAGHRSPDLYDGAAGIVLYLAALARVAGSEAFAEAARGGARWLAGSDWSAGRASPGLHCGESGIVVTFLRLQELLGGDAWLSAARIRARRLRGVALAGHDLLYGTAGLVVALSELYEQAYDPGDLAEAERAGEVLLNAAEPGPQGAGLVWRIKSHNPSQAPSPMLGLSHGAAGVGLALVHVYRASGKEKYLAAAQGAAEMLIQQAAIGQDGSWRWPLSLGGDELSHQAWCHGAAGIGKFLLHLYSQDGNGRWLDAVRGAATTSINGIRGKERLGLCCGVAGCGSFLLDAAPLLGSALYSVAQSFGGLILESEGSTRHESPDLMQGEAGIGSFMLRLADPTQQDLILPLSHSTDPAADSAIAGRHNVRA